MMKDLVKELTTLAGPSGFEDPVRRFIQQKITSVVDQITVDAMGNLHAVKQGHDNHKKIMLAAHMDEVGLMVTHVDKKGFARFTNLGSIFPRNLVGSRVIFTTGVTGVVNMDIGESQPHGAPHFKNLYIDTGAAGKDNCPLSTGDVAIFYGPFVNPESTLMSKSLDDRAGCAVLIETLKRLSAAAHQVHIVFTTQEEVGARGATTGAFIVEPDVALSIDVTGCGDVPGSKNRPVTLGGGPVIKIKDHSTLTHPAVKDWLITTAQTHAIQCQRLAAGIGGTDARAMQIARGGAAAGAVAIPCRNIHTPTEIVNLHDLENTVALLVNLLTHPLPESLQ